MARLLVLLPIALLLVLWWLGRRRASRARPDQAAAPPAPTQASPACDDLPAMMVCARCGVHFPGSERIEGSDGQVFCTEAHRQLAQGAPRR